MGRGKVTRRDANWWSPLNQAYRKFIEVNGHKPDRAWLESWCDEHGDETWPNGDRPSIQHAWDHCKCLRTLDQARDYFRAYRARKKDEKDVNGDPLPNSGRESGGGGGGGGSSADRKRNSYESDQQAYMGDSYMGAAGLGGMAGLGGVISSGTADLSGLNMFGGGGSRRPSAMDIGMSLVMADMPTARSSGLSFLGSNLERLSNLGAMSPGGTTQPVLNIGANGCAEWGFPGVSMDAGAGAVCGDGTALPVGGTGVGGEVTASDDASTQSRGTGAGLHQHQHRASDARLSGLVGTGIEAGNQHSHGVAAPLELPFSGLAPPGGHAGADTADCKFEQHGVGGGMGGGLGCGAGMLRPGEVGPGTACDDAAAAAAGGPTLASTYALLSGVQAQQQQLMMVVAQLQAALQAHVHETDASGSSPVDPVAFAAATSELSAQAVALQQMQANTLPLVAALLPHSMMQGLGLGGGAMCVPPASPPDAPDARRSSASGAAARTADGPNAHGADAPSAGLSSAPVEDCLRDRPPRASVGLDLSLGADARVEAQAEHALPSPSQPPVQSGRGGAERDGASAQRAPTPARTSGGVLNLAAAPQQQQPRVLHLGDAGRRSTAGGSLGPEACDGASPRGGPGRGMMGLDLAPQLAAQLTPQAAGVLQLVQAQMLQAQMQAQQQQQQRVVAHEELPSAEVRLSAPVPKRKRTSEAAGSGGGGAGDKRMSCTLLDLAAAAEALERR